MEKLIVRKEFYDVLTSLGESAKSKEFSHMAKYILERYDNDLYNSAYRKFIKNWRYEFEQVASGTEFIYKIATVYRNPNTQLIEVKEAR